MDRDKLIRECLVLICFLENINTNNTDTINSVIKHLNSYSIEELNRYYTVDSDIKEKRLDRIINNL
jgi:hypothetical protein